MSTFPASPGPTRNTSNGWKTAAIGGMGAVLLAVGGWIATDATTARAKMAEDLVSNTQRIAVLEEANRNVRESQQRIEKLLDEIRDELQRSRK